MPLTDTEGGKLDQLLDQERIRLRTASPPNMFWLIDAVQDGNLRQELLRLVQEAKAVKQAEISAWPTKAQAVYQGLQAELAVLSSLETKLS